MGGVEKPRGQTLKGALCPIEELGLYLSAVGVSKKFQAGGPDVDISFAHHYLPGTWAKVCTLQGLNKY